MKNNQLTLFALLGVFVIMVGLLAMQSAQRKTIEIPAKTVAKFKAGKLLAEAVE